MDIQNTAREIHDRYAHYLHTTGISAAAPGTAVADIHTLLGLLTTATAENRALLRTVATLPDDDTVEWATGDAARTDIPHADRYSGRERAFARELVDTEAVLAEALGYQHHPAYGWVIGDHTTVTLAMEARRRGIRPATP